MIEISVTGNEGWNFLQGNIVVILQIIVYIQIPYHQKYEHKDDIIA